MSNRVIELPEAEPLADPTVEILPAGLRSWREGLPFGNPRQVAELAIRELSRLNRYPERIAERTELMQIYEELHTQLAGSDRASPGAPTHSQWQRLAGEMAYGYKHLIAEALGGWLPFGQRRRLLRPLQRAIRHLTEAVLLGYERYDWRDTPAWREALQLCLLAGERDLDEEPVDDPLLGTTTIAAELRRNLLLRLLDPGRLHPGEARRCHAYLGSVAARAELEPPKPGTGVAGRFLFDLSGGEEPRLFDPDERLADPGRYRVVNLVRLSKRIHRQVNHLHDPSEPLPPGLEGLRRDEAMLLLRRILKAWHVRSERQSQRVPIAGWCEISVGISAVQRFLVNLPELAPSVAGDQEVIVVESHSGLAGGHHYRRLRCRMVNRSQTGIALQLPLPTPDEPGVGQLLLLEPEAADAEWLIGIVSRCTRLPGRYLEIGVRQLRGLVQPIAIRAAQTEGQGAYQPGLYINRGSERSSSLILSHGSYREGVELLIEGGLPADRVVAGTLVESSPGFDRFRFATR